MNKNKKTPDPFFFHLKRRERLVAAFRNLAERPGGLGIAKSQSNLFRARTPARHRLDLTSFCHVLEVDPAARRAVVEGMTTYDALVAATLPHGLMPAVVPELRTITIGGALAGIGIEATSFRHGLVHDSVEEFDALVGDGRVLTCSARENTDLFRGFPNSYGTLGYALRVAVRLIPVRPFVRVRRDAFDDAGAFLEALRAACEEPETDFVEGVIFDPHRMILNRASFVESAPRVSNYCWMRIYYRSLLEKPEDFLTARDYLWRWDADWFWSSRHFGLENPVARFLLGRFLLNSYGFWRLKRWAERLGLSPRSGHESIVQDVGISWEKTGAFLEFFHREIGILPIWICPFRTRSSTPLFPVAPERLYCDVAFWDSVPSNHEAGYFNRMIERQVADLGGVKSLYSTSYYGREEFAALYGGAAFDLLKQAYDPSGVFADLHDKCVTGRADRKRVVERCAPFGMKSD